LKVGRDQEELKRGFCRIICQSKKPKGGRFPKKYGPRLAWRVIDSRYTKNLRESCNREIFFRLKTKR